MFVVPEKELCRVSGWLKDLSPRNWVRAKHHWDLPLDDDALMARAMPVIRYSGRVQSKFIFDRQKGRKLAQVTLTEITLSFHATDWLLVRAGNPFLLESYQNRRTPKPVTTYHQLIPRRLSRVRHTQ